MTVRMSEDDFARLRAQLRGGKEAKAAHAKAERPLPAVKRKRSVWVRADGTPSEAGEARALAAWLRREGVFFLRIPNEGATLSGAMANVLKATGLETDAPDYLILDHPIGIERDEQGYREASQQRESGGLGHFCGIALELKAGPQNGKYPEARPGQVAFLAKFEKRGWISLVCHGAANAIHRLQDLGIGRSVKNRGVR